VNSPTLPRDAPKHACTLSVGSGFELGTYSTDVFVSSVKESYHHNHQRHKTGNQTKIFSIPKNGPNMTNAWNALGGVFSLDSESQITGTCLERAF